MKVVKIRPVALAVCVVGAGLVGIQPLPAEASIVCGSVITSFSDRVQGQSWTMSGTWVDALLVLSVNTSVELTGPSSTQREKSLEVKYLNGGRFPDTAVAWKADVPEKGHWDISGYHLIRLIGGTSSEYNTNNSVVIP